MVQEIAGRDVFGSIGKGFGRGLSEQLPKEIERGRLSAGLKDFAKNAHNLTPLEQFAQVSSIPGVTPQMIQAFPEIAKQQGQANALRQQAELEKGRIQPEIKKEISEKKIKGQENKPISISDYEAEQAFLNPKLPPSESDIVILADKLKRENPAYYKNDANLAYADAERRLNREVQQDVALQQKGKNQQQVQDRLESDFAKIVKDYNANVPTTTTRKVVQEALNSLKRKEDGGEELTISQAIEKYGKKMDSISQDYNTMKEIGGWAILSKDFEENKKALRTLRDKFKERGDLENFKNNLIVENGLSESMASYLAYPVSDEKELNNGIMKLKDIKPKRGYQETVQRPVNVEKATREIIPDLAKKLGKNGSVLAVGEELKSRGYDPIAWVDYVREHKKELNLTESQLNELDSTPTFIKTPDDVWMFWWSGLDKLLEK